MTKDDRLNMIRETLNLLATQCTELLQTEGVQTNFNVQYDANTKTYKLGFLNATIDYTNTPQPEAPQSDSKPN